MTLNRLIAQTSHFIARRGTTRGQVAPLDGLLLLRERAPRPLEATLYEPTLCLILQGRKEVLMGEHAFSFGAGECLLVSNEVPVSSRVTRAPYLALVFTLDVPRIRKLYDDVADVRAFSPLYGDGARAAVTHRADVGLLDALSRYMALADAPDEATIFGPLIATEIYYRLLMAPFGEMLRCLGRHDSNASAIARAIGYIRRDLRLPIAIPELAKRVGMSASSFHKHFKTITAATPLQYQKELRLLEARQRLRTGDSSVTSASFDVGYESPSQFSREYARMFGVPPSQDRRKGIAAS